MFDAYCSKFRAEIGVATVQKINPVNEAFAISCRCSDDVLESSTQVGNHEFGAMQLGGTNNNSGMSVVCCSKSTTCWAKTFGEDLNLGTQTAQCVGVSESIFVDRFMHNAHAVGLGERGDERRLPVGHESGMNIGLKS